MALAAPDKRYIIRTGLFMAGYVAVNLAAAFGAFDGLKAPGSYALALIVAAPVVGQLWATFALMRESDEYIRQLTANRFMLAAGIAIALFSAWGFMESYAQAPHAEGWLIYPLFWACFGVVAPFVRTTR